jgi:hypothetical protein
MEISKVAPGANYLHLLYPLSQDSAIMKVEPTGSLGSLLASTVAVKVRA